MIDLLLIIIIILIALFFWQLRLIAELGRLFAQRECQKQKLQLITIAMTHIRPAIGGHNGIVWKVKFSFEFSTDGFNQYQAFIWMYGKKIQKIQWPVFTEPLWLQAPKTYGSIGGGCDSNRRYGDDRYK